MQTYRPGQKLIQVQFAFTIDGYKLDTHRMKPSTALNQHRAAIRSVVMSYRAENPRIFGSVVHGDDTESSDLDILIDPRTDTTLMDVANIQLDLERLLGVSVDVLTPKALPLKFRSVVLAEAVPV